MCDLLNPMFTDAEKAREHLEKPLLAYRGSVSPLRQRRPGTHHHTYRQEHSPRRALVQRMRQAVHGYGRHNHGG